MTKNLGEFRRTYDIYEKEVVIRFLYAFHGGVGSTRKMTEKMYEIEKLFKDEIDGGNLSGSLVVSGESNWLWCMHDEITVQQNIGTITFIDNEKAKYFCEHYLKSYGYIGW